MTGDNKTSGLFMNTQILLDPALDRDGNPTRDGAPARDGVLKKIVSTNGVAKNGSGHALNGTVAGDEELAPRPVDIMSALSALKPQLVQVEAEIERLVTTSVKSVADVATHTLGAGGKRLRPALTILAAQLCDQA
jgi:hypothetical protein